MKTTDFERTPISLVDVTLRDGEQMNKNEVDYSQRIEVFDQLVLTGIGTFEIGHLGNSGRDGRYDGDQLFAQKLIQHINSMSEVDDRYKQVKIQVLFGSQTEIISEALDVLEGFDKDRVIIHVYDRLPINLRRLASKPYSEEEASIRVCRAADEALNRGYRHFSVSAEGATDCTAEQAVDYYTYIAQYLDANGAETINLNLANTYGYPPEGEWDAEGLAYFNKQVKASANGVTTSVHVHNDDRSATEFSVAAIKAGFNTVEGTLIGMGERCGNVNLSDVIIRLLEIARIEANQATKPRSTYRLGYLATRATLFNQRLLDNQLLNNLKNWYDSSAKTAQIYGTERRFHASSLGDPEAYNAGSGPHDNAAEKALSNPAQHPLWRNYIQIAIVHAMLGRPEADGILAVNPNVIKQITVNGSAGGNATDRIINGEVVGVDSRQQAIVDAQNEIQRILDTVG